MSIIIRLFAGLREQAGMAQITLELPQPATVTIALDLLQQQLPHLHIHDGIAVAINQTYVTRSAQLRDSDELALIPPVSGG